MLIGDGAVLMMDGIIMVIGKDQLLEEITTRIMSK